MTHDEKLSADAQSEHGMQQPVPLDGSGTTPSVLQILLQQARTLEAMAFTVDRVVAQNQDLMAELLGREEEEPDEAGHGVDMAGKRIKVS